VAAKRKETFKITSQLKSWSKWNSWELESLPGAWCPCGYEAI